MKITYDKEHFHVYHLTKEILEVFPNWAIDEKRNKFQIYRNKKKLIISIKKKLLTVNDEELARLKQVVENHSRINYPRVMTQQERIEKLEQEIEELRELINQIRS